jgi:hypothetical protein
LWKRMVTAIFLLTMRAPLCGVEEVKTQTRNTVLSLFSKDLQENELIVMLACSIKPKGEEEDQ